jgi:oligopeptidase B
MGFTQAPYLKFFKQIIFLSFIVFLVYFGYQKFFNKINTDIMHPPIAKKIEHTRYIHGQKIDDPYFWMRDANWPKEKVTDSEILGYLRQENSYADNFFDKFSKQKDQLFEELKGRITLNDKSVSIKRGDYYYYTRTFADKEHQVYYRTKGLDGAEQMLLDVNQLAEGKKYTSLGAFAISPDQNLLAFCIDYDGSEFYSMHILDIQSGKYLADVIENISPSIVWSENKNGIFYCDLDDNWRSNKVLFHEIGSQSGDLVVFQKHDEQSFLNIAKTASKRYLIIDVANKQENHIHTIDFADSNHAEYKPKLFAAARENIIYKIEHNKENFYIRSNDQGANFRLAICDIGATEPNFWRKFIDLDEQRYLDSFDVTKDYLILNYKVQGLVSIEVIDTVAQQKRQITFPDNVYQAAGYSNNFVENDIKVSYSSLKRPSLVYSYDFSSQKLEILKTQQIPSGFNPDEYEVKRIWADSDGVKVPVSILYKKSLFKADGSNPCYLYGYGSYGLSVRASFQTNILSLVDRGFVYVIAHIRGGGDLGRAWYEEAKFLSKKLTFQDFIAASLSLIEQKYTSKGNIVISGGSAGGMLVGSVVNSRPDLYKGVVAHVPFVDVLNTMLDKQAPLTQVEFKEWGNPEDKEFFDYIKSYSPYDNIVRQNYPSMLVTGSIHDPRVGYYEPAKWVARLRELKTDNNLLLLKTNMDAGHAGGSGRFEYLKEEIDEYLFVLELFNIAV